MLTLTIRTDKPEAEVALFDDTVQLAQRQWYAHRELSTTLHATILELLDGKELTLSELNGIVAFQGPGSFTGLRIGLTVANSLAYGLGIPIVAAQGEEWIKQGITRLDHQENDGVVLPEYGAPVHITQQKK